jgi:hypothetical protein
MVVVQVFCRWQMILMATQYEVNWCNHGHPCLSHNPVVLLTPRSILDT